MKLLDTNIFQFYLSGISYMTEPTATKLRENLIERQKLYTKEKDAIAIPEEHKSFIEDTW